MNKIVIEFCAEDRQRIDELIAVAGLIAGEMKSSNASALTTTPGPAPAAEHPADAATTHFDPPAPAPDPVTEVPWAPAPVSLGEFQKAIVTRCAESAATKQKVQALVHKYAASVSNIPEDKRSEVLAALAKI